jgi:Protein of unknown function (DUF5672)
LVLRQAATFLDEHWKITVYHSQENAVFVQGLIAESSMLREWSDSQRLSLHLIRREDYGNTKLRGKAKNLYYTSYWYSKMLTNETFWRSAVDTPYVLTLQSDTLLCRPFDTHKFIPPSAAAAAGSDSGGGMSYLGGISDQAYVKSLSLQSSLSLPLSTGGNDSTTSVTTTTTTILPTNIHLNGGLSLRNVEWMIDCIRQYNNNNPRGWVEDGLWNHCRRQREFRNGTVPATLEQALTLASDNGNSLCFFSSEEKKKNNNNNDGTGRICPVGVHKPWKKGIKIWGPAAYQELLQSCPGLTLLETLVEMGPIHQIVANDETTTTCRAYDVTGTYTEFTCQHCNNNNSTAA